MRKPARTAACSKFTFGLTDFLPIWFAAAPGASLQLSSAAVSAMLAAGPAGTYLGGRLSDATGARNPRNPGRFCLRKASRRLVSPVPDARPGR